MTLSNKEYAVLHHISEFIVVVNKDGQMLYFNKAFTNHRKILTRDPDITLPLASIFPSDWSNAVEGAIAEVYERKKSRYIEADFTDDRDSTFYYKLTFSPILADDGQPTAITVLIVDISHEKVFEKKTLQLLRDYSNLIQNANALIFSVDARDYVTEWNKECQRATGLDRNEVLTRKIYNIIDRSYHDKLKRVIHDSLQGKGVNNNELIVKNNEGKLLTLLVNVTPKLNDKGNPVGALFVGQDISELTEYRKSLEQKVKDRTEELKLALDKEKELINVKNRLMSIASHEFKVPLASIEHFVQAIRSNPKLRQSDTHNLINIEKQLARMKELLEDVLALEKGGVIKLKANTQKLNFTEFLSKLAEEMQLNTKNTHIIKTAFEPSTIEIESDSKLLRNIFINLLSNAIKFSPDKSEVFLLARQVNNYVEVSVEDHGIGIDEKEINKVLEPFNRGSNTGQIKGTGLGLSIVKKAVETLNGSISIHSRLNFGTTVTVKLSQSQQ